MNTGSTHHLEGIGVPEQVSFRVLLVDDQEDHINLLKTLLQGLPLSIVPVTCFDGTSALPLLEQQVFDCLFLDYDLPDMTGLDILHRAIELNPDQAVVLITARGNEELAVESMKKGATDYLVKGRLSREGLERVVHRVIERNQLRQLVRRQQERLIDAERLRVMMESIGATCHHFSQPVTSLMGRLEILLASHPQLNDKQLNLLQDCLDCTRRMSDLLAQFHRVRSYRTIPYTDHIEILDINSERS
jgi:CheY-like chemotaxis protein